MHFYTINGYSDINAFLFFTLISIHVYNIISKFSEVSLFWFSQVDIGLAFCLIFMEDISFIVFKQLNDHTFF